MGRPIRHFSHPHPLFPSSLNPQDHSPLCVVCKLNLSSLPSYTCQPCNFHIHLTCFQLPQKIRHSFDENHLLSLISSPKYQEGRFLCDACGEDGDGFAYHCGECGIDLHTVCAIMPSRVTHQYHPHHQLSLTFSTLADGRFVAPGSFRCNVCHGPGSNSWLYSCNECGGFDAHLLCARRKLPNPPNLVQHEPNRMQQQIIGKTPFHNIPNLIINNLYPFGSNTVINNPYSFGTTNPTKLVRPLIKMMKHRDNNMPQDPSQVDLVGPLEMEDVGPFGASGSLEFDPSVYGSVDPLDCAGYDPSIYGSINPSDFVGYDPSGLGSIDPSIYYEYDPAIFGSVDPSDFVGNDLSVFGSVDPSVFSGFDPSVFGSVDPSFFAGFDPSIFESVDMISGFDPDSVSSLFSGLGFF